MTQEHAEARRIKAAEPHLTNRQIAERVGISVMAVWRALNPDSVRRTNARRAAIKREWDRSDKGKATRRSRRLVGRARVVLEWTEPPSQVAEMLRQVFLLDWQERPDAWPREEWPADASDRDAPSTEACRRAVDVLRKQIGNDVKALLIARN